MIHAKSSPRRRVGERVRRPRHRDGGGELRVAHRRQRAAMAATTKLMTIAGPATSCAARPVSVKMPAPITTPTPNTVRSSALSDFLRLELRFLGVGDRLLDGLRAQNAHVSPF